MNKTSTGHWSTGNFSTGDYSTGHRSTGNRSTGNRSTGDCSTGDWSTGDCSTGHRSTGDWSTGHRSTGNRSTGHYSTGDWSISNCSTGHFSTIDYSGFGAFNKPCTVEEWKEAIKPSFIYFNLTEWIRKDSMTDQEKEDYPSHKTTGGYLKVYSYKEAWAKAYKKATDKHIELLKALPNFDADVFKEISGIDVREREKVKIVIDGKDIFISKESADELKRQLKGE